MLNTQKQLDELMERIIKLESINHDRNRTLLEFKFDSSIKRLLISNNSLFEVRNLNIIVCTIKDQNKVFNYVKDLNISKGIYDLEVELANVYNIYSIVIIYKNNYTNKYCYYGYEIDPADSQLHQLTESSVIKYSSYCKLLEVAENQELIISQALYFLI